MGHRHAMTTPRTNVDNERARWVVGAELAYCRPCMDHAEKITVVDLAPDGIFDSLWRGWVEQLVVDAKLAKRPAANPSLASAVVVPEEFAAWHAHTRACMKVCAVRAARRVAVHSPPVLRLLRDMGPADRVLVLDDVLDGLTSGA